ncbi:MAG: chromosome segregation ATPase [Arenicella sp.]|jgi:chromosome segregation ATPase
MSDTKTLITSLDQKVDTLVSKLEQEKSAMAKKQEEINELNQRISAHQAEVSQLKGENEDLKNKPQESTDNSEDLKVKIDGLVREIDKCISLLKV